MNDNIPEEGSKFSSQDRAPFSLHEGLEAFRRLTAAPGKTQFAQDLMLLKGMEDYTIPISMCPTYFNSTESQR